jgi:hypothetical protein
VSGKGGPTNPPSPPGPETVNLLASPSASPRVIRAPGRLVVNPTDLGHVYPHGGAEIGRVRAMVVRSLGGPGFRVMAEGLGEPSDILKAPQRYVLSFFLRGFDDAALASLWPDQVSVGDPSGHATFLVPGLTVPGQSAVEDRSRVLLFVPDDVIRAPAILVYRGIPDWADVAEMAFQRQDELGLPMTIECLRDSIGNTLAIGRLADLTL